MENRKTENRQGNLYIPKEKIPDLLNWRANVVTSTRDGKQYVVREHRFAERKSGRHTYYVLVEWGSYYWKEGGELLSEMRRLNFLKCHDGSAVISGNVPSFGCNYLMDLIIRGIVKQFGRNDYEIKE